MYASTISGAARTAAAVSVRSAAVQAVRGVFPVFCGMSFPIVVLPEWGRAIALALPPTYLIADLRQVLLAGANLAGLLNDLAILLALGLLVCGLAVVAFRRTERYARRAVRVRPAGLASPPARKR